MNKAIVIILLLLLSVLTSAVVVQDSNKIGNNQFVKLLFNANQADEGVTFNNKAYGGLTKGNNFTRVNTPKWDNANPSPLGNTAMLFALDDGIYHAESADWALGNVFTIHFWIRWTTPPADGTNPMILHHSTGDDANRWWLRFTRNGATYGINLDSYKEAKFISTSSDQATICPDAWVHWAIVQNKTKAYIFRNGQSITLVNSGPVNIINLQSQILKIGYGRVASHRGAYILDELTVVKGRALWEKNFKVPTKRQ